jgi:hypothetical protein
LRWGEGAPYGMDMDVTFTRTGDRRYRVSVERADAPNVVMEPAPGFEEYLPHDLVHLLVEQHWRLGEGIYGDLAAGGDAGTFRPAEAVRDRRLARRNTGLATSGRDMDRSEQLAAAAFAAWQVHRGAVSHNSEYARETAAKAGVSAAELDGVMSLLDGAAARWSALRVGESMSVEWRTPAMPRGARAARPRRIR